MRYSELEYNEAQWSGVEEDRRPEMRAGRCACELTWLEHDVSTLPPVLDTVTSGTLSDRQLGDNTAQSLQQQGKVLHNMVLGTSQVFRRYNEIG